MNNNTDKPVYPWQRYLAYVVSLLINVQPALANVIVNGGNTQVTTAGNGVEVVNIATPNGKGLSHNKYQQFNVDKNGLILNNSTEQLAQSQLGGILQNNPNLTNGSASVILNEVTGTNRSQLMGYTEVFGSSAPVILTNPYGITCNGCGFINTPRVTLSTGDPKFDNGQLSGFDVSQGSVSIEGLGLDGTNQTYFDIISRTLELNAEIHANELNIVTGPNEVSYQTNEVTRQKSVDDASPRLAIDSSLLGGMYAGRISLVATEKGVGVNLGNIASSQGDITLTADGKITIGNASSANSVALSSNETITLTGQHSAASNITYNSAQVNVNNAAVVAGDQLSVISDGVLLSESNVEANALSLDAKRIGMGAGSELISQSTIIDNLELLTNEGQLLASNQLLVTGDELRIEGDGDMVSSLVDVTATNLLLDSEINSANTDIEVAGSLTLTQGALITATEHMAIDVNTLAQNGQLLSAESMTVQAEQATNSGKILSGNNLTLVVSDVLTTTDESQLTAGGLLSLEGDTLNLNGHVSSVGNIEIQGREVRSAGVIKANGTISMQSESTALLGHVESGNEVNITSQDLNQQGSMVAANLVNLDATNMDIAGQVSSLGNVVLTGDDITQSGDLYAKKDIRIDGDSLLMTGSSLAESDLRLSGDTLSAQGELVAYRDLVVTARQADIQGDVAAKRAVQLNASELSLSGHIKSLGDVDVQSSGNLSVMNTASVTAQNALSLAATSMDNKGALHTGQDLTINVDSLVDNGSLTALNNLDITANSVDLNRTVQAGNDLSLNVAGTFVNDNKLLAGNDLRVEAASMDNRSQMASGNSTTVVTIGNMTNRSTGVVSGNNTHVQSAALVNDGKLQALQNLGLDVSSLTNRGSVAALNDLSVESNSHVYNYGLIFAGRDARIALKNKLLNQQADILSNRHLTITEQSSANSSHLHNRSGNIESGGNLTATMDTVDNTRLSMSSSSTTTNHTSAPASYTTSSYASKGSCSGFSGGGGQGAGHGGGGQCSYSYYARNSEKHYQTDRVSVVANGQSSRLVSGGNMAIKGKNVSNSASLIASDGNLTIDANSVRNEGFVDSTVNHYAIYSSQGGGFSRVFGGSNSSAAPSSASFQRLYTRTGTRTDSSSAGSYSSVIQAKKALTIRASSTFINSVQQAYAGATSVNNGNASLQSTDKASVDGKSIAVSGGADQVGLGDSVAVASIQATVDNQVSFPEFRIPANPNGLFFFSNAPQSDYLIETNPLVTDMGQFLGSDYFQDSVGFFPEQDITFLGDAFYDTRMITQAIFEQTGQRYLNQSVGSDLAQMKQLIDAAGEQQALDLSVGIALTADQIASLTDDMVWYEEVEINGRLVLAPKLYIAQANERHFSQGATIAGGEVFIESGEIANSGNITSDGSMALVSESTIFNTQGNISAKDDLTLLAQDDIWNQSGQIGGKDIVITSVSGDVVNETLFEQINVDANGALVDVDDAKYTRTRLDKLASISGSESVTIQAGDSVRSIGSSIESDGDVQIVARNDIELSGIDDRDHIDYEFQGARTQKTQTDYTQTQVKSGGSLSLSSGGDLTASGTSLSSQEQLSLNVGGDLALLANKTIDHDSYNAAKKKSVTTQTRQQGVVIDAGDNVKVTVGGDATLVATEVSATNDITLDVGGQLAAIAATETEYSHEYKESSSMWGDSSSDTEIQTNTAKGSAFKAGGSINLTSQGDQVHQASDITAGGDVALESTQGSLTLVAAEESHSYRHETIDSGFMVTMAGEGETSTTQKITSIKSGGEVSLAGALGIQVDYVSTNGQLARALNELPAGEEYAWMAALKDNPNVDWNQVNEAFDSWDYEDSTLSGPAAAIIAIAVAVVTAGTGVAAMAGTGLSGAIGGGSVVAAVGSAATTTLISQASLSLINNQGDIGATLKDLGSSEKLKILATAMVTAGVLQGVDQLAEWENLNTTNPLPYEMATGEISGQALLRVATQSTLQSGIDVAINGGDFSDLLLSNLTTKGVNELGASVSAVIGDFSDALGGDGSFTKSLVHGVTQGGMAELRGDEFAAGMAGGFVAELAGESSMELFSGFEHSVERQLSSLNCLVHWGVRCYRNRRRD